MMNNADFDAMARESFGLVGELADYPFVRVTVPQVREFARKVYDLGDANGKYEERQRQRQPWRRQPTLAETLAKMRDLGYDPATLDRVAEELS